MKKFRDCVQEWLDNYKRNSVKEATFDRLETSFKLMDNYKISWIDIGQLDTDYIQEYLNDLVRDGYAMSTIKKQYNLITSFMDHATVKGIVETSRTGAEGFEPSTKVLETLVHTTCSMKRQGHATICRFDQNGSKSCHLWDCRFNSDE